MLNNRKLINILKEDNENLKEENEWLRNAATYWRERNQAKDKIIKNLEKDIEVKEDSITNLLDANKELSLANTHQEKKIRSLTNENAMLEKEIQELKKRCDLSD